MRVTVFAQVERSDGSWEMVEVLSLARSVGLPPGSGMGLVLAETRQLTTKLQEVVLHEQAQETAAYLSRCRCCSEPLGVKSRRKLTYRTAYGKATLPNPQLYSQCSHCGTKFGAAKTFSPMSQALPERTHPQWIWLQSRFASVMSYRMATSFLAHGFTGATTLAHSSSRRHVQQVGERLESEVRARVMTAYDDRRRVDSCGVADPSAATHAIQIDAGYIRAVPATEGSSWISVIASKVVRPEHRRTHAHAYCVGYDPWQGLRQQAFLTSVGIGPEVPLTVLCDGGEDVALAAELGRRSVRILDWFHIGMKFEHLIQALRGLKGVDSHERDWLIRRVEGAKWLLWHGKPDRCIERLMALRRDTGWAGKSNALGRLIRYLNRGRELLVNYGARRAQGQPISSAGAESAVDYILGQRLKRNGHMRWTRRGANNLLQVRCALLNGQDVRNFKRWYPEAATIRVAA